MSPRKPLPLSTLFIGRSPLQDTTKDSHFILLSKLDSRSTLCQYLKCGALSMAPSFVETPDASHQPTLPDEIPVIIIGGGPSGLFQAWCLSKLGGKDGV